MASETKPSPAQNIEGKVAMILSTSRVVVNKGSNDGVKRGDKFVVYEWGEEVFDPDTRESLGRLQITKGLAEVVGLQNRLAILEAVEYQYPARGLGALVFAIPESPTRVVKSSNDVKVVTLCSDTLEEIQ